FQSIFELDQVLGVTPEQMQFLRPFITVHSFLPEPDLSVAPPALFAALTGAASDEIARLKDRPFPNTLDRRGYPARGGTVAAVLVHVEARTADGATFVREALLTARGDMPGGAQSIKEWRGGRSRFGAELMELERQGLSIPSC
ncbi:MAG: general secretion pathway protein GspK, partial [Hyphomicrobiales bacterium]|nr:general secretion pathway protein GspK [Hyphomicrobiales bacterium]